MIFCERSVGKISLSESARGGRVRDFSEYKSLVFPDFYGSLVTFGTFGDSKVQIYLISKKIGRLWRPIFPNQVLFL